MFPHGQAGNPSIKLEARKIVQVVEHDRQVNPSGEVVALFQTTKLSVRLVGSFSNNNTMDDLLYLVASQKLSNRIGKGATSLFLQAAMV